MFKSKLITNPLAITSECNLLFQARQFRHLVCGNLTISDNQPIKLKGQLKFYLHSDLQLTLSGWPH